MPIFVDTSAWYALLDKTDSDHASAVEFKNSLNHSMITTNYVADEIFAFDEHFDQYEKIIRFPNY